MNGRWFSVLGRMGKWHYEEFQALVCKGMGSILEVKKNLALQCWYQTENQVFNASVLSVLLYATETYVIDATLQNKINAFQTQWLRIILNISRDDHVRNEYIYKQTNTKPLMQKVTKTQLSFLGHSIRRSEDDLIQQYCLYVPAHGRRRRGRHKTTYLQHIAIMIYGNASVEEKVMRDAACDRAAGCKVMKAASRFSDNGWDGADQERF